MEIKLHYDEDSARDEVTRPIAASLLSSGGRLGTTFTVSGLDNNKMAVAAVFSLRKYPA